MKRLVLLLLCALYCTVTLAKDIYFVGHSLVNHDMPRVLDQVARSLNQTHTYRESIINGSSLKYHWNNAHLGEGGVNAKTDLPTGLYQTLLLTEQVPVQTSFQWNDPVGYATQFIQLARTNRADLSVYLYETWPHQSASKWVQPTWDQEIAVDLTKFEQAADQLSPLVSTPVRIVPGGLAMKRIKEEIAAGRVSGLTQFSQLFADDIHLTPEGNYYIAMVFYATFYGASPVGAPGRILNRWGGVYVDVPEARKLRYQELAWDVVRNYPRTGVGGTSSGPILTNDTYAYQMPIETAPQFLQGYWGFDEVNGTQAESSVGEEVGTLTNFDPSQVGVAGRFGRALYFDGVNNHVNFGSQATLMPSGAFSITAWTKGIPTDRGPILSSAFNYGARRGLRIEGSERADLNRARALAGNGSTSITITSATVPSNVWRHIAVTYDRTYLRLYLDGQLSSSRAISNLRYDTSRPVTIGAELASGIFFKGHIDEFRIYSKALSAPEIRAVSTEFMELSVPAPGVLGNDQGTGLTVSVAQGPQSGQLELDSNGGFRYRPFPGITGTDTFRYRATDANGGSSIGTVTLQVTAGSMVEVE